jgi:hypothetical protein
MPRTRTALPVTRTFRLGAAAALLAMAAGCTAPAFDFDLPRIGREADRQDVADAAPRPDPDGRGVISYPEFQVAVARRGDTVADVANRVGLTAGELRRAARRDR